MRVAQSIEEFLHTPQVEIVRSIEKGGYFLVIGEAQDIAERCLIIHCGIISRHEQARHEKGKNKREPVPSIQMNLKANKLNFVSYSQWFIVFG